MNAYVVKLAAFPRTGGLVHMVADFQVIDNSLIIMSVCGKVIEPSILMDVPHNQISCSRCRSVSAHYNHAVGYHRAEYPGVDMTDDDVSDIPF